MKNGLCNFNERSAIRSIWRMSFRRIRAQTSFVFCQKHRISQIIAILLIWRKTSKKNNARPKIKDEIENFSDYETVFVGYPNWWGDMPMILYTFFDTYDFSGKTIIPFNTHGGSGFSGTISTIRNLEPNATVKDGKSISRNSIQNAEQEIIDWVRSLGFERP